MGPVLRGNFQPQPDERGEAYNRRFLVQYDSDSDQGAGNIQRALPQCGRSPGGKEQLGSGPAAGEGGTGFGPGPSVPKRISISKRTGGKKLCRGPSGSGAVPAGGPRKIFHSGMRAGADSGFKTYGRFAPDSVQRPAENPQDFGFCAGTGRSRPSHGPDHLRFSKRSGLCGPGSGSGYPAGAVS